jgi:hypothetical protein
MSGGGNGGGGDDGGGGGGGGGRGIDQGVAQVARAAAPTRRRWLRWGEQVQLPHHTLGE